MIRRGNGAIHSSLRRILAFFRCAIRATLVCSDVLSGDTGMRRKPDAGEPFPPREQPGKKRTVCFPVQGRTHASGRSVIDRRRCCSFTSTGCGNQRKAPVWAPQRGQRVARRWGGGRRKPSGERCNRSGQASLDERQRHSVWTHDQGPQNEPFSRWFSSASEPAGGAF